METQGLYGWLSKLWSHRDPKRDHKFGNHPYRENGKENASYDLGSRVGFRG